MPSYAWIDGLVASLFTLIWIMYIYTLMSIRTDKLQNYMRRRVILTFMFMIFNITLGTVYTFVALYNGYPNEFDAQATFAFMAAYIVSLALDFPPYSKMLKNGTELDKLLSRRKFKPGEKLISSERAKNGEKVVYEIIKYKRKQLTLTPNFFGGPVYTSNPKHYVYIPLGSTYLLGLELNEIKTLFCGHNSYQDYKIMRSIELAILPTNMLVIDNDEVNILLFLIIAISSSEGCTSSLGNWKGATLNIKPWVKNVVEEIRQLYNIKNNYNSLKQEDLTNPADNSLIVLEEIKNNIYTKNMKEQFDLSTAKSLMVILNLEKKSYAEEAINTINKYYEINFENNGNIINDSEIWRNITDSMFTITQIF